jgi:myo-inositol-1(or 4)-monophosphatase
MIMPTLRQLTLQARLRIARRAAQVAGNIIMAHYGQVQTVRTKSSDVDLVTLIDEESDELIREILKEECPDDTVITEETFQEGQTLNLESAWIVDPLDGTTNYAHGFPHFAVSIAYVENGQVKAGVIFDPLKNELFTVAEDSEVLKNGRPIRVSATETLGKALLATGFPYDLQSEDPKHNNIDLHSEFLLKTHGIRRAGAAALDMAYVACGRLDGFWEMKLAPWDIAAGLLMVRKAGGKTSGFQGQDIDLTQRRIDIVGSNTRIHEDIVGITQRF